MCGETEHPKEPVAPPPAEASQNDLDELTKAYKSGVLSGGKRDNEQGYRLTLGPQGDTYREAGSWRI